MGVIKADQLREATFVLANGTRDVHAALIRTNGTVTECNAATVDRILDEHDELLELRRRIADYELLLGTTVDIGAEATVFVRLDEVAAIVKAPPALADESLRSVVILKKDGVGIGTPVTPENLVNRIRDVRRQRAERGL